VITIGIDPHSRRTPPSRSTKQVAFSVSCELPRPTPRKAAVSYALRITIAWFIAMVRSPQPTRIDRIVVTKVAMGRQADDGILLIKPR
jgi:hypothetical protein